MIVTTLQRLRTASLALGALVLAACGGGGGGASAPEPPAPPAGQIGAVAWAQSSARVQLDAFANTAPPAVTASLTVQSTPATYWFRYDYDPSLARVDYMARTADDGIDFIVSFVAFPQRAIGNYTDTLRVTLCHDEACARPVQGSPFTLPLRLEVGYFSQAEAAVTPWVPAQTTVLNHDVVGAAYSAALDAVITVSARPEPVLRVHDLRSGLARSLPLLTAPTSLSVGADGLQAAVGHDAAVSLVDLRAGTAPAVRRMEVPMPVGEVVLAGSRIVATGAQANGMNSIHWVDTVTGRATRLASTSVYAVADAVLHPAGDRVYLADRGVSPDDITRLDLGGDASTSRTTDSRYHGDYMFCGRAAVSPDGRRLYTGCGVMLSLASALADDMLYAGQLVLSPRDPANMDIYLSTGLSVAADNTSLALLEQRRLACSYPTDGLNDCHTRLAVYDTTTLQRRSLQGLSPFQRGSDRLKQLGRRVMYRADGSLVVVAEALTRGEATPTWLLHRSR